MSRVHLLAAVAALALPVALAAQPAAPSQAAAPSATVESYAKDVIPGQRNPETTVASGVELVTAADPRAAAAGAEMLKAGGTAVDAAIATMLALNVIEPESSGIGGGGFLLVYDAKTGKTLSIDGREKAPKGAGPGLFMQDGKPMPFPVAVAGGYSVGVPGALALAADAHQRWGKLPWAKLFEPAIRLARDGFVVTPRLFRSLDSAKGMLLRSPAARAAFFDASGNAVATGTVLRLPQFAATLSELAEKGPDAFYKGPVGAEITRAVADAYAHQTALTAADLASYKAIERPPLCLPYRQVTVCSMGPPSYGGIGVLQIVKQLERFDLKKLGAYNLLSQHLLAESERLMYADREAWGGDSDFEPVPVEGLLSNAYLRQRSSLIRLDKAMETVSAGTPPGLKPRPQQRLANVHGTTHFAAVDRDGSIATYTNTIESVFGSGLMAGGFMLNNELTDFDFNPKTASGADAFNAVAAEKRPRSSMAPTIIYDRSGKPLATFGAAGGYTIIAQVAKAVIAYVDWGMSVEDAIAFPLVLADRTGVRLEAKSRLADMEAGLKAMGHKDVKVAVMGLKGNGLARTPDGWRGAADPRSEGKAVAISASGALTSSALEVGTPGGAGGGL